MSSMRETIVCTIVIAGLTACGGSSTGPSATTRTDVSPTEMPASVAPSASVSPSPSAPAGLPAELEVDGLAQILVSNLSLRAEPTTVAERLGILTLGEPAYVVDGPVEADGYQWYQLGAVRQPYVAACGDPAPAPSLECADWFGWAAGLSPEGDRWLAPLEAHCPAARDTDAYIPLPPATRLACAGGDEWRLVAYLAPEGGRGCYPVWVTNPRWLDGACNLLFPQPEQNEYDSDERLQAFVHPDLGKCGFDVTRACPFDALTMSWVEMVGHLDDPVASTCIAVLSDEFEEPPPFPGPDPDSVSFNCRLRFVVTDVHEIATPAS